MPVPDLIIRGRSVVLPDTTGPRAIYIQDGRIISLAHYHELVTGCELVDVDHDSIIMPGLVDTHVHINSPGRTEWEGFHNATLAAAAGGVTTLVDMPLNSVPPTTTLAGFKTKLETAAHDCFVDVGFWGGVVPGNTAELAPMFEAGVVGFKCFLVPSGVDEFPHVTEENLREAMPELTRLGALLIVHAELPGPIKPAGRAVDYQTFLASRPREAENEAVELMIRLSREFGTRVHIVHLSSAEAIPMLRKAQAAGVRITAETCPHYLHFAAEEVPERATEFKCCPPIRERENREKLWQGLADGTIDFIVSDHSPCPGNMKLRETGDFMNAWGGIASLQLRLPVIWTEAHRRGFTVPDVGKWLCASPAKQVSLQTQKGSIAVGNDADLVVWNPDQQFNVTAEALHHRHKITPYEGEVLSGVVQKTFLRGRKIYDGGHFVDAPLGHMLLSKTH
jgi:allantoinase